MKNASAYVIGLSPYHLLKIELAAFANADCTRFEERIGRIKHGCFELCDVPLIPDLDTATDMVEEIKRRYNEIQVFNINLFEVTITGTNDFDPNELHIYEVNIGTVSNARLKEILQHAIRAYVFELDQQGYDTDEEISAVLLNEFGMTKEECKEIMGLTFEQWR